MITKNPIAQSALLVIDAQDSFMAGERWKKRNNPKFEENVERLVNEYRAAELPVLFFLDRDDDDEEFRPGSPYFKVMDFLQPGADEPVISKTTRNCFTGTDLDERLKQQGIKRVIITGIKTEQCCETTARVASDMGYDVDFVTEATLTFPIPHTGSAGGKELPVDEVVTRTEYALRDRFAKIKTVDELVAELKTSQNRER